MTEYAGCCCLWGMAGDMADNRAYAIYLRDEDLAKNAMLKIREYQNVRFKTEAMERQ